MEVRCPQCNHAIGLPNEASLSGIACPSCGSSFSLLGDAETVGYGSTATSTLGHFDLVNQIGAGAFAVVWRARDQELDRLVAVKIPRKGKLSAVETEHFLREARAAAQLRHPNIVSVHEVGREGDTVFIVSDYVEGVTLADWLTGQRLTSREAAKLCAKVADALHHAHESGVIHRDLKPANIVLDADGEPHVMDFGLARRDAGEVTMTLDGKVLGTPAYMSPEQAKGAAHHADRRSDVYALGVILFELLTGERPFRGNVRMLLHQVINDEAPSPRRFSSNIARDLETICLKCLSKEPNRRYASAQALADDLERYLANQPIQARPVRALERAWRWARRNPLVAGLAITLVLTMAGGLVGVTSQWRRATSNLEIAQKRLRLAQAAVDDMLIEVGNEELRDVPEMESVRRSLLKKALAYYEQFLRDPVPDPELRRDMVQAQLRVGDIHHLLGLNDQAERDYKRALALQEKLVAEHPDRDEYRKDLASAYGSLGTLYFREGKFDDAGVAFKTDNEIMADLAVRQPGKYAFHRASTFNKLGALHREMARWPDAQAAYNECRDILKQHLVLEPHNDASRRLLAAVLHNLGLISQEIGSFDEAADAYKGALEELDRIAQRHPKSTHVQQQMAQSYNNLGWLYNSARQAAPAREPYEKSVEIMEKLAQEHPAIPRYQFELARAISGLAHTQQFLGQDEAARSGQLRAISLLEPLHTAHPNVAEYQSQLAFAYVALGWQHQVHSDTQEAENAYSKALILLQPLVEAEPRVMQYRRSLGRAHHELGLLHEKTHVERAHDHYRQALRLRRELAIELPSPLDLDDLAWTYNNLALVLETMDQDEEAVVMLRKAAETRQRLVDGWLSIASYRDALADSLVSLAWRNFQKQQHEAALDTLKQAIAIREALVADYPETPDFCFALAGRHLDLGNWLSDAGDADAAVTQFDKAIKTLDAWLAGRSDHPKASECKTHLRLLLRVRARTLGRDLHDYERALTDIDRALQLEANEDGQLLQLARAEILACSGNRQEALAAVEMARQAKDVSVVTLCEAARVYALVARMLEADESTDRAQRERLAKEHADCSLQILKSAFGKDRQLALQYVDHADFDYLASQEDFRGLVQDERDSQASDKNSLP